MQGSFKLTKQCVVNALLLLGITPSCLVCRRRSSDSQGSRAEARHSTSILVSWYALQTAVMYAYAPGIELMYGNMSSAVESHAAMCLKLTLWSMGSARQFLAIPRVAFESTQRESRSLINRVRARYFLAC